MASERLSMWWCWPATLSKEIAASVGRARPLLQGDLYDAGNHESYIQDFEALMNRMRRVGRQMGVHFLDRDKLTIDGMRFLGTKLWSEL